MGMKKTIITNFIIIIIGIIYLIWYRLTHLGIPCVFRLVTDLYCPGCGITRMFVAISRFDFAEAIRSNAFVFVLLPYGIFVYARHHLYRFIQGEEYSYNKYHRYILILILVMAVAFGIIRNLPYFNFLRPYV